jgi:hypothetical protein
MTRNGKIARLLLAIRQQLNQRLQNGELAQDLLSWLNRLPEVQAILATHFAAKPIDKSNLTHWKQGGYPEWEAQEQAQRTALAFLEAQPGEPKQERIRQIMGIGEDYGPAAAPESLLTTATRT